MAEEIKRIKAGDTASEAGKSMRKSPKVVFLKPGSSSSTSGSSTSGSSFGRTSLLARFPAHLSNAALCVEAGSGYGEWVVCSPRTIF